MTASNAQTPGPTMMGRQAVAYAVFAALLLTVACSSMRQKSLTFDECAHLPAGYTYLVYGDFRLNPEHPPLLKMLAAVPLWLLGARIDAQDPDWKEGRQWHFGSKLLYEWNDADRLLFRGRVPIVLLSLGLGLCVSRCAARLYGEKAGYLALVLYLASPDLSAHGQLVTTDLGVAGFMFIAVYGFYRALTSPGAWSAITTCLAVGLALLSKFSAVLVFPMLVLVAAAYACARRPIRWFTFAGGMALIVAAALTSLVLIWACYGFRYQISPSPAVSQKLEWNHFWAKPGVVHEVARAAHVARVLPEGYLYGFLTALESTDKRPAFLMGRRSTEGWWYYFLVTFLIKTPIPFLLMIVLASVLARRHGAGLAAEAMLLLPVGLYVVVSLTSHLNIGHRHLLPVYPFLIVFVSKVARLWDPPRRRALATVTALLLAWTVAESALIYPDFLAYFNEIAGGPSRGYEWLVDSNLDWGQDLKGLARFQREHPDDPLYLSYFGTGNPAYHGVRARLLPGYSLAYHLSARDAPGFDDVPPGALVAVSATNLQAVFGDDLFPGISRFMERLRRERPIARIGYSIFVYRQPPETAR